MSLIIKGVPDEKELGKYQKEIHERNLEVLERMREELNEKFAGKTYDFSSCDHKGYAKEAKDYVESHSEYQVSDIHFGSDKILHITLEPKPVRTIIDLNIDRDKTKEDIENDGK